MLKYVLKYWFEHGGTCLWSMNDEDIIQLYKDSDFAKKAKMLPVTFVIKARKV